MYEVILGRQINIRSIWCLGKVYYEMLDVIIVEGAVRDCNECGERGCVILVANRKGLWSKCLRCSFVEWEWGWEDKPEYISYLARVFNIKEEAIMEAIKELINASYLYNHR